MMNTALARKYPTRVDVLYQESGKALRRASPRGPKKGADAAGVSVELFRRWLNGERSNPVGRALELALSLLKPFAVATLFRTHALQTMLPMNDRELIDRFFAVLRDATAAEARQIARKVELVERRDLAGLREASEDEAALDDELAAACAELQKRRLNPWTGRRAE
jgi:hypothetical protein